MIGPEGLALVFTSTKVETESVRSLAAGAPGGGFGFSRKHYAQHTRHHGAHKAIVLTYNSSVRIGDAFFNSFLPDLPHAVDRVGHPDGVGLLAPAHAGILTSISRGKHLNHFIDSHPGATEVYTFNTELHSAALGPQPVTGAGVADPDIMTQIALFETRPVLIPTIGAGHCRFSGVSLSHRRLTKPNELNFVFKYAFQADGEDEPHLTTFLNDEHHTCDITLNIHLVRAPGNNAPVKVNDANRLKEILLQNLLDFNGRIMAELAKPNILDLNTEHLEEAVGLPGPHIHPGAWPAGNPAAPLARSWFIHHHPGAGKAAAINAHVYWPNVKRPSMLPPPVVARVANLHGNKFATLAMDDDPDDLVEIKY